MTKDQIANQLEGIAGSEDFATASEELVDQWASMDVGLEAVEPILQFMEKHSTLDFGMPGAWRISLRDSTRRVTKRNS